MSEGSGALWRYLRDLLPGDIHATRVENRIGVGFPDVHYIHHGVTGHLELKFLRKKKLPFGDQGLNPDQLLWIRNALECSGLVWIVAEVTPNIYFIPGQYYSFFNTAIDLDLISRLVLRKREITENERWKLAKLLENKA